MHQQILENLLELFSMTNNTSWKQKKVDCSLQLQTDQWSMTRQHQLIRRVANLCQPKCLSSVKKSCLKGTFRLSFLTFYGWNDETWERTHFLTVSNMPASTVPSHCSTGPLARTFLKNKDINLHHFILDGACTCIPQIHEYILIDQCQITSALFHSGQCMNLYNHVHGLAIFSFFFLFKFFF